MARKVEGSGPSKARIMVVGEAPGGEEELQGQPFVGAAGKVLRQVMMGAGINPTDVWFTNICKYRPPGNELVRWFDAKTGTPDQLVLDGIMELRDEIRQVDPTVIVALGNYPLWALTGKAKWNHKKNADTGLPYGYTGISDWRGSIIPGRGIAEGRKVVAAYHPAAILRKWPWRVYLDLDLKRALAQSQFSEIRPLNRQLLINPEGQDRIDFRERLLSDPNRLVAFDIEYIKDRLLCVGFCNSSGEAGVIKTEDASDLKFVRSILESGIGLAAQNGMFDCSVLEYWYKMPIFKHLKYDTMLASHSAYIELPKDLGTLCSIYTEQPCYWTEISWDRIKKGLQPVDDVLEYNAIDAWVTHEVMQAQMTDELEDKNVRQTFEFEMSLLEPLWEISKTGVPVDRKGIDDMKRELEQKARETNDLLDAMAGWSVNVRSTPQVRKLLYDQLGFSAGRATKSGAATDDKTLAELGLKAKSPQQKAAIKFIREIRKNANLISKFCEIEFDSDDRYRSHYNPAGTTTGRLASRQFYPTGTGGNGQNLPRDKRVRKMFRASKGHVFFYNDLERAESLVVAQLTGDPLMLAHHQPKVDAHKKLAAELYGVAEEEINDDQRYMGKQTRHAGNYMQGPRTFMTNVNKYAEQTGVSVTLKEAEYFIKRYRDLHPFLGIWWRKTEIELRQKGTLYNLFGRPRTFFDRHDAILPEAIAYKPQSTVGDCLNIALLRVWNDEELRELGVKPLMQVHDAIGGEVPEAHWERAMARMRQLMKVDILNPNTGEYFNIPVEIAVGPTWGEVKKWEGDLSLPQAA